MFFFAKFSPKKSGKNSFSFRENLPFLIFSILFHLRKALLRTNTFKIIFSLFDLSYEKNSSVFWKWISLFFCFSLITFFSSFFRHFLFLFITFRFQLFFISFYVWSVIFLVSRFFEQQFHLPFVSKKNSSTYPFFMHALPLYVPLLIDLFICCLFFSLRVFPFLTHVCFPFPSFVFSVHNFSERKVYGTAANLKKCLSVSLSLFVGHLFHIYLSLHVCLCFEISLFWFILICCCTIFAVKPHPPARVKGCTPFFFFDKAAELKRFRSHPTSNVHAVYTTLGGWEVFESTAQSSSWPK